MKKFLKKLIVMYLLGGLILAVGKGGTNKPKPMNEIDPGPANTYTRQSRKSFINYFVNMFK